jgi:hypothetical protein
LGLVPTRKHTEFGAKADCDRISKAEEKEAVRGFGFGPKGIRKSWKPKRKRLIPPGRVVVNLVTMAGLF